MKAEAKGFKFLTLEGKVKVPFFQRTYVWDEDNWEDLITELLSDKTDSFLGAIILKQLPTRSGEPKQLEVIDGQQRLTTLSILLKALYDVFPDEVKKNCEEEISGILRFKKDYASSFKEIRIEHSLVDSEAYRKVIDDSQNISLESINENSHKILRCYRYCIEKLKQINDDDKKLILNKILNPENKMLVVIDIDATGDEQTIFDTLNTAGVRLTAAEIIKNALFKKAIEVLGKDEAIKLYEETWEKTFLNDQESTQYWEVEKVTGRLKRANIEILLHCIGVIKGFYDPDKHILSDLSKLYKEEIEKLNAKDGLNTFIQEIIGYADIYRNKILTFDNSTALSFEDPIARLLHILEVLQISTFDPYILYVFKEYQNGENQITTKLSVLEKFVVKNMLAKKVAIKNYNKLCKEFIQNTSKVEDELKKITDDDVSKGLRNISNKAASLILFWIELHRRDKDKKHDIKELKYDYSLEHIMPVNWEEHWQDIPEKRKPDGSPMTLEERKQDRNYKISWIGNMTLLKSNLNSAIRNLSFEKKMNGEGRKKGIRAYAELSITKEIVNQFDSGDKVWDEAKIEERTRVLEEEIKQIWG